MRSVWLIALPIATGCVDSTEGLLRPAIRDNDAGFVELKDAAPISRDASSPDAAPLADAAIDAGFAPDVILACGEGPPPEPIRIEPATPYIQPFLASNGVSYTIVFAHEPSIAGPRVEARLYASRFVSPHAQRMVEELDGLHELLGLQLMSTGGVAIGAVRTTSTSQVIMATRVALSGGFPPVVVEHAIAGDRALSRLGPGGLNNNGLALLSYRITRNNRTTELVREFLPLSVGSLMGSSRPIEVLINGRDPIPTLRGFTLIAENSVLARIEIHAQPNGAPPSVSRIESAPCGVERFDAATDQLMLLECGDALWFVDMQRSSEPVFLMNFNSRLPPQLAHYRSVDEERIAVATWGWNDAGPRVQIFDLSGRPQLDAPLVFEDRNVSSSATPLGLELAANDRGSWGLLWSYNQSSEPDPLNRARVYFSRFDSCARPPSR